MKCARLFQNFHCKPVSLTFNCWLSTLKHSFKIILKCGYTNTMYSMWLSGEFESLQKYLQSVTKIHIYLFLKYVFFAYISGTTWDRKRFFTSILFASLSKELSDEKSIFEVWSQNQLIFWKTLFWQKKVSYWKKSAILKNSKTFFHGSKV